MLCFIPLLNEPFKTSLDLFSDAKLVCFPARLKPDSHCLHSGKIPSKRIILPWGIPATLYRNHETYFSGQVFKSVKFGLLFKISMVPTIFSPLA